ncbi:MAG: hypothetical protein V3S12_05290, partial [Acidiferrobacterales bacterium]
MASAGTVTLELDANSVKLIRELQKSKRATKRTATSMRQSMAKTFSSMKRGAAVMAAAFAVAATAMARLTAESFKSIDAIGKQADKLGIATEALVGMQLAAEITGSTAESLVKGLTKMQKAIVDGAAGMTTYTRAFDALNLSARDLIKLSPDQQYMKIARALKNVNTQTERVGAFSDIFGARNSLLLNLNVEALERYRKEADRLGLSLSRMEVKKIEDANDAMLVARRALTGIGNSMAITVAPLLKSLAERFSHIAGETRGFRDVTNQYFRTAVGGAGALVDALRSVGSTWDGIKVSALGALAVWQQAGVFGAINAEFRAFVGPTLLKVLPDGGAEAQAEMDAARERRLEEERALAATITSIEVLKQKLIDAADGPNKFRDAFLAAFDEAEAAAAKFKAPERLVAGVTSVETAMLALGVDTVDILESMSAGFVKSTMRVDEQHDALKKVLAVLLELGEGAGGISLETYNRALAKSFATMFEGIEEIKVKKLGRTTNFAKDAFDQLTVFADQAARNMQDAFAEFLFDPFKDGLDGMLKGFLDVIRRMLAQQAAAQLFGSLSNFFGGNALTEISPASFAPTPRTYFPTYAHGGSVDAGVPIKVGELGTEIFVPGAS